MGPAKGGVHKLQMFSREKYIEITKNIRPVRNFMIRNRDSHRLIFLIFLLRVKELVNSDCRFGFCMKNWLHSQLEMSRVLDFDPKIRNVQTLVPKNAISYHTSPAYYVLVMFLYILHDVCMFFVLFYYRINDVGCFYELSQQFVMKLYGFSRFVCYIRISCVFLRLS